MDSSFLFAKGILIGIAVAAPVGPVGLLCIQRTLEDGLRVGLATGLGAAVADTVFGAVAAYGLASISDALMAHRDTIRVIGGGVLLVLAWGAWRKKPPQSAKSPVHVRALAGFGTGLAVTLSNPMTIMGFLGIFAGLGLDELAKGQDRAFPMVAGVAVGSALWWLGLCGGTQLLRPRIGPENLKWANKLAALLLVAFAVLAFGAVIWPDVA
jgi:threonine/homoserine/homoserine lactone efflux protein